MQGNYTSNLDWEDKGIQFPFEQPLVKSLPTTSSKYLVYWEQTKEKAMFKHPLLKFILLCVLVLCVASANAEYIDLSKGGMIVSPMVRCDEEVAQVCFVVEFKNEKYIVVHDKQGEKQIIHLKDGKPVVIWTRGIAI